MVNTKNKQKEKTKSFNMWVFSFGRRNYSVIKYVIAEVIKTIRLY